MSHVALRPRIDSPGMLPEFLALARAAGFAHVELPWWSLAEHFEDPLASAAVRELLDPSGLLLAGLHASPLEEYPTTGLNERLPHIRKQMQLARELGLPALVVSAGQRQRLSFDVLCPALQELLEAADALGLDLLLANGRGTRLEQLDDFHLALLRVEHPRLRLYLDLGQFHESAVNPRDALRAFGERAAAICLGDRIGRRAVPLDGGETNMPAILESIRQVCPGVRLVVEGPPPGQGPQAFLRQGLTFLDTVQPA